MSSNFLIVPGGWLSLERILHRQFGSRSKPLEPAPHNDVGPTDSWKGHNCDGEEANIAENPLGLNKNLDPLG